jgi:hypothetical protein
MTSKFEQLIEYVINDDEQKARELFHNIVVEKSREIYENLMNEEDGDEEDIEEGMDDTSGSASEDMMREVESDENGMNEEEGDDEEFDDEAEEDGEDLTKDLEQDNDDGEDFGDEEGDMEGDMEGDEDLEDRVIDLEDKLDELMAEFEQLMGDEAGEDHGDDDFDMEPVDGEVGGDAYADDDTSEFQDQGMPMSENVSLQKVAPAKMGDNGANTRSPTTFNSGAAGMQGAPVRNVAAESNPDGTSAYKAPNSYAVKGRGDLKGAGSFKNVPAKNGSKLEAAPKPHLAQGSSNTRSPLPKG